MHYGNIIHCDIANGLGCRVSLFVSGCTRHCKNCFNPQTWDFQYGEPFDNHTIDYLLELQTPYYIKGLTILGGEPLEPQNIPAIRDLVYLNKKIYPCKDIWLYTGHTFENIKENTQIRHNILPYVDVIVDGPFIESEKDVTLAYCGSRNQRIIDVQASIKKNQTILYEF